MREQESFYSCYTGNKKVLALKLAFENLPADANGSSLATGHTITKSRPSNKRGGKRAKMGRSLADSECRQGYIGRCEGRNRDALSLCCDCNDGEWKTGVSHCTECETEYNTVMSVESDLVGVALRMSNDG